MNEIGASGSLPDIRSIRGMILAAGLGTRLAPVTDHLPKALLPIAGRPLLDHIITSCDGAHVQLLAVNTHHLADQISAYLLGRPDADRFKIFHEPEILGTGGALHGARSFLEQGECFLLHNGDVWSDLDLAALIREHQVSGSLATLAVCDWPEVNTVAVDSGGTIVQIAGEPSSDLAANVRRLTYTGIGIFSRRILADIGPGFSSLIAPLVRAMQQQPGCVRAYVQDPLSWSDLGTLPRYLQVAGEHERQPDDTGSLTGGSTDLQRLTGHGSDRKFWRLGNRDWSAVAMQCPAADEEFDRYVAVARFLVAENLGAPELLAVHVEQKTLLMEDVGSRSLYSLIGQEPEGSELVPDLYTRVLDHLLRLQRATDRARAHCIDAVDRVMDYEHLRWETDYFQEHFLGSHLGLAKADRPDLEDEFHRLAECVARQPQVLIHRDFQSQNIFFEEGKARLVDFQGMRLGPLAYDAAALLWDPYVHLGEEMRDKLLDEFCLRAASSLGMEASEIAIMARAAGLQRLMQALGAFGFLGQVKGKPEFLEYVPRGIRNLHEILDRLADRLQQDGNAAGLWSPGPLPQLSVLVYEIKARTLGSNSTDLEKQD